LRIKAFYDSRFKYSGVIFTLEQKDVEFRNKYSVPLQLANEK
jgi:hypothetical protein